MLSKKFCTFDDLASKVHVNIHDWITNIKSFFHDHVVPKYQKLVVEVSKSSEKMYVCKEDKEGFTKSKIILIT